MFGCAFRPLKQCSAMSSLCDGTLISVWFVLFCFLVGVFVTVLPFDSIADSSPETTIYVLCHYVSVPSVEEPPRIYRKPCFLVHSPQSDSLVISSWSAIQPLGIDTAVVKIVTSTPQVILNDTDVVEFPTREAAISYIRSVLKYKGVIKW